jgi:EmrB/QacA subfamily drug resistance transporter
VGARTPHSREHERIDRQTWKIAAVTGAGAFMAMLDSTIANLALESIRADLTSTLAAVQWVATGYLVALAVSLPAAGWLGSRYGYGHVWAAALAAFTIASAACAVAPGLATLIGARLVQGLAAGLMIPSGQAVIGSVARPDELGRLFGVLGLVISLGPAVGPAVGGVLLDAASWRWVFWINVPVGIAALVFARGLVAAGSTNVDPRLDRSGLALLGLGLPLLLYGATETGSAGITTITVLAIAAGAGLTVGLLLTARRTTSPLIDLRLLHRRTFAAATATTGLTGANMFGGLLLLPLYLQLQGGWDATATGLMLLAMGLGSALALPVAGALTDRHGAGRVTLAGAALLIMTTVPFLFEPRPSAATVAALLIARGVGLAWAQMPPTTAAYASVTADQMGDATTLVNIVQRVGGAVGAAGLVIALAQAGGTASSAAYTWAFAPLTGISILTVASAAMLRHHAAVRAAV